MIAVAVAGAATLGGCDRWLVRMETRIDRSGRLERETRISYQPVEQSDEGRGPDEPPKEHPPIAEVFVLPDAATYEKRGADEVVMRMSAASPADLPAPDFAIPSSGGERPQPHNRIDWRVEDCVLFDRYVYREAYRDNVVEAARRRAIDELHAMLEELAFATVERLADGRYETEALRGWLATDGRNLLADIVRIFEREKDDKARDALFVSRLRAEAPGLDAALPPEHDGSASRMQDDLMKRFVAYRLASLLLPPEGVAPLDPRDLLLPTPDGGTRLGAAAREAVEARYGSEQAFGERLAERAKAITGDMDGQPIAFEARVTLPGRILRTNGLIERVADDATVLFLFDAKAVARTGHALEVETVVMKPERLYGLPSPKAELDGADLLAVMEALHGLDAAARAELSRAFARVASDGVDGARAALPEGLVRPFERLVAVGSRD